ncbi:MAG TPA: energy transducer TonB [Xanthobacteraceae bacterium]|jgi:TonB family protein|nr:energy transducer TonB [Xanthobacteraceae bacterium]
MALDATFDDAFDGALGLATEAAEPHVDEARLRRRARMIWIIGALGALAIHGGTAAAVAHFMTPDSDDLGAPGLAVSVDLTAPQVETENLALGPTKDASAASPAMTEQKEVVTETDLPKDKPTETDDPMQVVTPVDSKKPVKDELQTPTAAAQASEQSIATEATAMQSVENAVEGPRNLAPAIGVGTSLSRDRATWQNELSAHFDKFKRYPEERVTQAAQVVVSFVLDRTGHILSSQIVKGSGDPAFDHAALDMLQRSDPVPAPPSLVADRGLSFTLPVDFHVKKEKK